MKFIPIPPVLEHEPNSELKKWRETCKDLGLRNAELDAEIERLRDAAQAVVDRWHTPLWKDVEATGAFINRLEAALAGKEVTK